MDKSPRKTSFWKYAGLATQFFAGIGITLWLGQLADKQFGPSFPLWVWLLPLLLISGMLYRIIRETSSK
ncbi:MAG TPA: hypothetical protein DEU93_02915 [Chitinophagaceae bacterium]|nr:hypothetical protein [Chitinophagaceae bacterium]